MARRRIGQETLALPDAGRAGRSSTLDRKRRSGPACRCGLSEAAQAAALKMGYGRVGPGQEFVDPALRMATHNAGDYVRGVGLWVDAVRPAHGSCPVAV